MLTSPTLAETRSVAATVLRFSTAIGRDEGGHSLRCGRTRGGKDGEYPDPFICCDRAQHGDEDDMIRRVSLLLTPAAPGVRFDTFWRSEECTVKRGHLC